MRLRSLSVSAFAVALLATSACGSDTSSSSTSVEDGSLESDVSIVATTSIWGDLASAITECASGSVETIMPVGADPHDFSASSQDVTTMSQADLVVANGLGLEESLVDTIESLEEDGVAVMEVAPMLSTIEFEGGEHEGEEHSGEHEGEEHSGEEAGEEHGHEHSGDDPHVWHDAERMAEAASLMGDELAEMTGDDTFSECGSQESDRLTELDSEVSEILSAVPEESRTLVTDHDAFGYFADAYDFEIAGTVIPANTTLAQPSSGDLSELVETVQDAGVPAIFSSTVDNPSTVEAVAAEAGADISVVELFVGSLGPDGSGAETYEGMMRTNAQRIADGLSGTGSQS